MQPSVVRWTRYAGTWSRVNWSHQHFPQFRTLGRTCLCYLERLVLGFYRQSGLVKRWVPTQADNLDIWPLLLHHLAIPSSVVSCLFCSQKLIFWSHTTLLLMHWVYFFIFCIKKTINYYFWSCIIQFKCNGVLLSFLIGLNIYSDTVNIKVTWKDIADYYRFPWQIGLYFSEWWLHWYFREMWLY